MTPTAETNSPIIEKLRKLIEHEKSARQLGSMAEAEAFTSKIQELLMAYNLELAHITPEEEAEEGEIGQEFVRGEDFGGGYGSRRVDWLEHLASAVARNCFCKSLIVTGSNTQVFVGLPLNRSSAIQTFKYLAGAAQQIANTDLEIFKLSAGYLVSWDKRSEARLWKRSFPIGFASAISSRVAKTRKDLTSGSEGDAGLVLVKKTEESIAAWMEDNVTRKPAAAIGGKVGSGYASGFNRGNSIGLRAAAGLTAGGTR